jgi:hypothetical protein
MADAGGETMLGFGSSVGLQLDARADMGWTTDGRGAWHCGACPKLVFGDESPSQRSPTGDRRRPVGGPGGSSGPVAAARVLTHQGGRPGGVQGLPCFELACDGCGEVMAIGGVPALGFNSTAELEIDARSHMGWTTDGRGTWHCPFCPDLVFDDGSHVLPGQLLLGIDQPGTLL